MKNMHTFVILAHKESDDLEECIKSVMKQSVKTNVVIATSTKNDYIIDLASKYGIGVMVNDIISNKGNDYNYAIDSFKTPLVTIAHQDDLYDRNYVKEILEYYENNKDASIIFTDNYEIDVDQKIKHSKNLFYKRYLKYPLKWHCLNNKTFFKLRSLKYMNSICTSSVTFIKENISSNFFPTDLKYENDWQAFINLAKKESRFAYLDKKLVGYRVFKGKPDKSRLKEKERIYISLWGEKKGKKLFEKMVKL